MKKTPYTVKEIAKLSGCSVATVSRVINQNGRFSKETEARIQKIIEQTKYQPNGLARGLRTYAAKIVAILVPDISNEFFARIAKEIQACLFRNGYIVLIYNTNEDVQTELQEIHALQSLKISGMIYISGNPQIEKSIEMPIVYIDREPIFEDNDQRKFVLIESDNLQGGKLAAEELIQKGCRNLACVSFGKNISSHKNRVAGYKEILSDRGLFESADRIIWAENATAECGYLATEELLRREPNIDGIFYTADLLAMGAYRAVREYGLHLPEQLKIVGFDDISQGETAVPALSTIRQNVRDIGDLASKLLLDMIDGKPVQKYQHTIPVTFIHRQST